MSQTPKRPYGEVFPIAAHIRSALAPYCQRIEIAGSLRRCRPAIGDIEIVLLPKRPLNLLGEIDTKSPTALDTFLAEKGVKLEKDGSLYKKFKYRGLNVDLFLPATADHWGCIYTIRTGSHDFNMWLMSTASINAGVRFKDGRLYDRYNNKLIPTPEERDVFSALRLDFIPPAKRDGDEWLELLPTNGHQQPNNYEEA